MRDYPQFQQFLLRSAFPAQSPSAQKYICIRMCEISEILRPSRNAQKNAQQQKEASSLKDNFNVF